MKNRKPDSKKQTNERDARLTIGLLTTDIWHKNAYATWQGAMDAAREREVNLICFAGGWPRSPRGFEAQAATLYELVSPESLDGLIVYASSIFLFYDDPDEKRAFLDRFRPLPVVTLEGDVAGIPNLYVDSFENMRKLISHLIKVHNYRRIAFIRGSENHFGAQERYRAYIETLAEYGLPFDPDLVTRPVTWPEGHRGISQLLDRRQVDFEAVIGVNDDIAIAAMEELQARGIRVPDDVAVVGYDDAAPSRWITPPLTTVPIKVYQCGWRALEMVLALIEGESLSDQVVVPTKVVVRQSCGCLNPAVEQAAVGPLLAVNEPLKSVIATRREEILSAMVQVIGTSERVQVSTWAEQLLDAFVVTLGVETGGELLGNFLSTLDEVLRQVIAAGGDIAVWQNVLSELRRHLLPYLSGSEILDRAENLWGQATIMIGEAVWRVQVHQRLQAEQQAQTLREIGQTLITTFDLTEMIDILARDLPRLGIPGCYLSLYENPVAPAEWSRLILAFDQNGRFELEPAGQRFPSRQLVPKGMLVQAKTDRAKRPYSLMVEPLYFRQNQLGFVLFEVGPQEGMAYEILRGEISSALQGAILVEKRRQAEEAMIKRVTELELVAQVSAAASTILDATELLERVANLTKDSFGLYHTHIYLLDEAGQMLELAAGAGTVGQQMVAERWRIPYDHEQSVVARAARTRQGVVVNDVLADSDWLPNALLPDTRSELAVPLMTGEKVLGVLDVQADEVGYFMEDDVRTQSTLAAQVAVALENARLFEEGQQNLRSIQSLYQTAQQLTSAGDLSEVLAAVVKVGPEGLINWALLGDLEYDETEALVAIVIRAGWHYGGGQFPVPDGTRYQRSMHPVIGQFLGSAPKIFKDVQHNAQSGQDMQQVFGQLKAQDLAVLPLKIGSRQTGVLWLLTDEMRQLHPEDIRPHVSLMNQVAIVIENQRLLAEMNATLAKVERTQRDYTAQTWETYWTRHGGQTSYQKVREEITSPEGILSAEAGQEMPTRFAGLANGNQTEHSLLKEGKDKSGLVLPLTVRNQVIGILGLQDATERVWTPEETAIVEAISEQLAQAMENLRLIEETRQRALREARINEMSEKIRGAQSLAEALQIAVKEVGLSLKVPQTAVQVEIPD